MKILIKSADIVEPSGIKSGMNILIEGGIIKAVTNENLSANREISGDDLLVSPGWVDMNVLMGDPGFEHKEDIESLGNAAAAGGFTEVACLPNTKPVIQSKDVISYIKSKSSSQLVAVHPVAAVTHDNLGKEITEMIDLNEAGAVAFSDGIYPIWHTDVLLKALQYTQKFDGVVVQRPEDRLLSALGQMNEGTMSTMLGLKGIPSLAEEITVMRDLKVLEYAGGKLHFSMISTAGSLNMIKEAKKRGLKVSCDIAAYQIALDDSVLSGFDTNYKVNPPLRDKKQVETFKKALKEGVIDAIVSGHRPHETEAKELEFDQAEFGILGLQTAFPLINTYTELDDLSLVNKLCYKPRNLFGLTIPEIKEGAQANLTVFDRKSDFILNRKDIRSKSRNTPFINKKLKGKVIAVFNQSKQFLND